MPATAQEITDRGYPVMRSETAAVHADLFARHKDEYPPRIKEHIERGQATTGVEYYEARAFCLRLRRGFTRLLAGFDAVLFPTTPSTAPAGLGSTGSAIFCAPASFTGLPSIALPSGVSDAGLPLSVQLMAAPYDEAGLLRAAAWAERVLDFQAGPPLPA
jgi:Asp-tRNA(Asn)/Glu-tRNA(Gln) amidotransferase A subunit family amidase